MNMVPRWTRILISLVAVVTLSILAVSGVSPQAVEYDFVSLRSHPVALSEFTATLPSVNAAGTVAFADLVFDPIDARDEYVVFRRDGVDVVPILNLTDTFGVGSPSSLVINDSGAIAVNYSMGDLAAIVRIDADASFVVLAQADRGESASAPYREFSTTISMNNAGQVAALVRNLDSTASIVRFDDGGAVEIAGSASGLFDLSSPTIIDPPDGSGNSGIVAFRARDLAGNVSIYTGDGDSLTNEGSPSPCTGSSANAPVINNAGVVLSDCASPVLFSASDDGNISVVLAGTEDAIFARLASGYSLNDGGVPVFVTSSLDVPTEAGLFTGNDVINHKVVRTGDVVFGLAVEGIRIGHRSINDNGQITFLLQVGDGATATSHVVLAVPRRISQTISFAALGNATFGTPPFTVTATATVTATGSPSGLPVTFAASGACSVAGDTVTLLGAGSCTLTASQSGDATYLPAEDVSQTFAIGPASQTITFDPLPDRVFSDLAFTVSATSSSGLPVTFSAAGACSVAGSLVTITEVGSCSVTASQSGNADYAPAPDVVRAFNILQAGQTITFGSLVDRVFGDPAFTVSATSSSGLPVTFAASGTCSIASDLVTITGGGVCTITASQTGNANYAPAPDVIQAFSIARAGQTITFASLADQIFGNPGPTVSATSSSGLAVTFSAAGTCALAGDLVTILGAGLCTVTASQSGNANYAPAPDVVRAFSIGRASQAVTFGALSDRTYGDLPFIVIAAASSGLPVTFSTTGNCSLAVTVVTITSAGACTVTASQAGSANFLPALDVPRTFVIAQASQTITFAALDNRNLGDESVILAAAASSGLTVSFAATGSCAMNGATTADLLAPGSCTVTASQAGNANFSAAAPVAQAFQISSVILQSTFNVVNGTEGFAYLDNAFRGTAQGGFASGAWSATGFQGGGLRVSLGGISNTIVLGMSGGWRTTFNLNAPAAVTLSLRGNLTQSPDYESDEWSQLLVSLDGALVGVSPNDYLAQLVGNGNGGTTLTTGWRLYQLNLGTLAAGTHTLTIGGYNNKKSNAAEFTTVLVDDVQLTAAEGSPPDPTAGARAAVASLNFARFKGVIQTMAGFGDRTQGSTSYNNADTWLATQLQNAGYVVERHAYTYLGQGRTSIYVTKVGTVSPDQMYIVSCHYDGRGGGGAANDNASGCALGLEAARALAPLQTATSVRFIFWNNEETGLNGSTAYANQRAALQGIENPAGSGRYPEPRWLGIIQHDMILFDHGLPPQPNQIANADIDVEYQASSTFASGSQQLANALQAGNERYSTDWDRFTAPFRDGRYPAQVGSNMNFTDSVPFRNLAPSVSVRDNQRVAEIGQGSNPHWHQPSDVYATYSELDFLLGFNTVQMTVGTVAELAGATVGQ